MSQATGGAKLITPRALGLVALGGGLGTLARFALGEAIPADQHLVILGINILGAFVLGLIAMLLAGKRPNVLLFASTGLCGGFTTYSAFAVGVAELALMGQGLAALGLAVATVVGGFIATGLGVWIGTALRTLRSRGQRS
ncbi:fluoride efflux transporter FluC [Leucobacter denitrificans]|uniref:fluoride efflux transporter FluC n=1 Tax=Leucobacter denitrificans TaxID=683042 RepID=UPI001FE43E5E|nr:CrcB family protein [Leucobacter denitrificans]